MDVFVVITRLLFRLHDIKDDLLFVSLEEIIGVLEDTIPLNFLALNGISKLKDFCKEVFVGFKHANKDVCKLINFVFSIIK